MEKRNINLVRGDTLAFDVKVSELDGSDITILSYGILINEALGAAEKLASAGISAEVMKLNRLDQPDWTMLDASVKKTGRLVAAEDCAEAGCVGTRALAELARRGIALKGEYSNRLEFDDGTVYALDIITHRYYFNSCGWI